MSAAASAARREALHCRGVRLEVFTVACNAVEGEPSREKIDAREGRHRRALRAKIAAVAG